MKKYLVLFLFLLTALVSYAGHIRGGVISYEHISAKKYAVYVAIWRDCSQTPLSASPLVIYNDTLGIIGTSSTGSQTKIGYKDVTHYDTSSSCGATYSCIGASSVSGFEEHTWKMTVDFANYSGCEFYLAWYQSSRSTSTTTGSANEQFLTDAYINICYDTLPRSIRRQGDPDLHVMYNRDWFFNPGFYSKEAYFDSVSHVLVNGLKGINTSITYNGNFNAQRPITFFGFPNNNLNWPAGFHLDPVLGTLNVRPTQVNQVGAIVIMYQGWKLVNDTMRLVGYSRYDFAPSILNYNTTSDGIYNSDPTIRYACRNQTSCFELFFLNTTSDSMKLTYFLDDASMGVDTLQWQPDSIRLRVCFTPDSTHSSSKAYRILSDGRAKLCPWVHRRTFTHGFMVVPAPDSSQFPSWELSRSCNQLKIIVADTASSGKSCYAKADSGSYAKDSLIHTLQEQDTGWFKFQVMQDWLGCQVVFQDSIYIDSIYHYSNTTVLPIKACANELLVLRANVSGGLGIQNILWGDSSNTDSFSLFIDRDTTVALRMMDSAGCFSIDTFNIIMNPAITGSAPDLGLCKELPNASVSLGASVSGGTQPYVYKWIGIGTGNNLNFKPPLVDTTLVFELIDSVNCRLYDTLDIIRYTPHYPEASGDTTGCYLGAIYLKPLNKVTSGTYYWLGMNTGDSLRYYAPIGITQRILRYTDTLGCITYDTIHIKNNPNPNFSLPVDTAVCIGASLRIDPNIVSGQRPFVYEWLPYSTLSDSFVQDVFYQSTRIHLKLTDSNSCYSEDFIDILISTIPQINGQSPYSHCTRDTLLFLDAISGSINGVWKGSGVVQINGSYWFNTRGLNPGSHFISFETQASSGGCSAKENFEIILHESPTVDVGLDTGLCGGGALVFRAIPTGGTLPYSFVWNDDTSKYLDSIVHFLNSDTLFHIALKDSNGCVAYDSVSGYFYTIPTSSILTPTQDTSLCEGNVLFIEGDTNSQNGVSAVYQFKYGIQNRSHIMPDSSFTLHYTALSTHGCRAEDSLRISLFVNPIITNIHYSSVCEDEGNILLDSLATPYGGAWVGKGVWTDSLSFYFNPDSAGTGVFGIAYLLVDSTTGCFDSTSTFVSVEEKTIVDFTADSTVGIAPMTSTFTNNSTGGLQFNYLWYFGDGDSSIMAQPTHTYTVPGFYDVQLQVSGNLCLSSLVKNTYIQVDTNTTGLFQNDFSRIQLYPNPNTGHLFLKDFPRGANFKVYDVLGREVEFRFTVLSDSLAEIRLEKSVSGTYMLEIISVEKRWIRMFVVE